MRANRILGATEPGIPHGTESAKSNRLSYLRFQPHRYRFVILDCGGADRVGAQEVEAFNMITHDERLTRAADRILLIEDGLVEEWK